MSVVSHAAGSDSAGYEASQSQILKDLKSWGIRSHAAWNPQFEPLPLMVGRTSFCGDWWFLGSQVPRFLIPWDLIPPVVYDPTEIPQKLFWACWCLYRDSHYITFVHEYYSTNQSLEWSMIIRTVAPVRGGLEMVWINRPNYKKVPWWLINFSVAQTIFNSN